MNTDFIKGVIVPILTPIDDEEKIDEQKLRSQVDYVIWQQWRVLHGRRG